MSAAGGRGDDGYTLLELLVVILILALLATATPRLLAPDGPELQAASRDLASALRGARASAVRQGAPVRVTLSEHGYASEAGERQLPAGMTLRLSKTAPDLLGLQGRDLRFFADGSATGGEMVLSRGRRSATVTVAWLDGQVVVHDR